MSEINDYIERFNKEIELDRKSPIFGGDVNNEEFISTKDRVLSDLQEFVNNYLNKYERYDELHMFANKLKEYLKGGLLTPLTLKDDEFKFIRYGTSENIRFPRIKKGLNGIYDDGAYILCIQEAYDSLTGREIETISGSELNLDNNRCYLIKGGRITNTYFNCAKIKQKYINEHNYTPNYNPISIPCIAIQYQNEFILCTKAITYGYSRLCKFYNVELHKDDNKELIKFNIDYEFD